MADLRADRQVEHQGMGHAGKTATDFKGELYKPDVSKFMPGTAWSGRLLPWRGCPPSEWATQ